VALMALSASTTVIIKPEDLVRTRSTGRTALVLEILCGHRRLVRDVITKSTFVAHVDDLHLVQSAIPKRWPSHITS
jgi:hypothetical protein